MCLPSKVREAFSSAEASTGPETLTLIPDHTHVAADTCPEGFSGAQCAVCQSDAGCAAATSNEAATCSSSFQFSGNTTLKSYSCNPTSPELVTGLLEPDSLLIQCRTGLVVGGAPGSSAGPAQPPPAEAPAPGVPVQNVPVPPTLPLAPAPAPAGGSPVSEAISNIANTVGNAADTVGNAASTIGSLFSGRKLLQAAGTGGNECDIGFYVASPRVRVACQATGCAMPAPGTADPIVCSDAACSCPEDATCGGNGAPTTAAHLRAPCYHSQTSMPAARPFNCIRT